MNKWFEVVHITSSLQFVDEEDAIIYDNSIHLVSIQYNIYISG
jgi:hypothetical protein